MVITIIFKPPYLFALLLCVLCIQYALWKALCIASATFPKLKYLKLTLPILPQTEEIKHRLLPWHL